VSAVRAALTYLDIELFHVINPLECKDSYSATLNNTKLVHWPLMGGLLHLVQRGGAWAGWGWGLYHTKCNSPPINGQCTNFTLFDVAL